jgi:hypothetical protein
VRNEITIATQTAKNRGVVSFARLHQLQDYFGPDLPLECVAERATEDFLDAGWPDLHLAARDARAKSLISCAKALTASFWRRA